MTDDHLHSVAPPVHQEVATLRRHYSGVRYEADERTVRLDVDLSGGWTPRVITVRIELTEHHPRSPPQVVLPRILRCQGVVPRCWLTSGRWLVRGHLGDPIIYYPKWGETQTLTTLIDAFVEELTALCGATETRRASDA